MNPKPISTGKIVGLVILGILIIGALWVMGSYNSFISLGEDSERAQSDMEVQYERRYALIPNLVSAVQGIFDQEKAVFIAIAEARTRYANSASKSQDKVAAINQMESALSRLLVVVENYPQLKSQENVLGLQAQLEGTENRISVARNNYNAVVTQYNKKVKSFPSNVIAGIFNFDERQRFEASAEAKAGAPAVKFDFK